MSTLFGLPPEDYHIFNTANNSHADSVTPKNDPSRIIMMSQRKDIVFYLQGSNLNWLMQQFTCKFIEILRREPEGPWQMKPDLYQYMTRGIFLAEVDVLYGEGIFKSCPTLCEDFWAFYEAIPVISRNIPTWMSPSSYVAQRKMLNNFRTWQLSCVSESNERKTGVDTTGPDDIWGTHYIRRMYERFRDLGFSEGGIATAMVGFLFLYVQPSLVRNQLIKVESTVANSIPASVWMMLYIFLDKDLRERVEVEISDAFDGGTDLVQTDKLMKAPLLNSICNEVLRLRVGSPFGRTSQSTVELTGGLKVLPGIPIMSVNWLGGLDTKFWNTGRIMPDQFDEHPLEQFWAERFLEYPDDTTSGPLRKDQTQPGETTLAGVSESRVGCARLITNGEALGKQIMLISVAVVLRELHIELQNPAAAATTGSKHRTLPFGSHAFDKAVPFKIRVRDRD
ncbi:cytochrome p450 domain-containing protein [Pochonia chlamydosporia 170]|uniref:Cytochrome p450 domain-containing protein n=1 Tax=Pochonia chlamydosporia 170 TaxID=1380566 RepID=A0A179F501_METCM|nr:cytochrome p450 domain-containing protein [Pochonia chlamydosporia 170]OAQ60189.1 cytochrome p450 domain-containing protein [Pochonia chlamydosporia 170]